MANGWNPKGSDKQVSVECFRGHHSECDGKVSRAGRTSARCECECHQEGVLVGALSVPSVNPPMQEAL